MTMCSCCFRFLLLRAVSSNPPPPPRLLPVVLRRRKMRPRIRTVAGSRRGADVRHTMYTYATTAFAYVEFSLARSFSRVLRSETPSCSRTELGARLIVARRAIFLAATSSEDCQACHCCGSRNTTSACLAVRRPSLQCVVPSKPHRPLSHSRFARDRRRSSTHRCA